MHPSLGITPESQAGSTSDAGYRDRRQELLRFLTFDALLHPKFEKVPEQLWSNVFLELPKFELTNQSMEVPPLNSVIWDGVLSALHGRRDCGDFLMNGVLRMRSKYWESPLLNQHLKAAIETSILDWMYWVDEPGEEHACFLSENHQVLYHTAELLAGQTYPDRRFSNNGQMGAWHYQAAKSKLERWLTWRIRFGFSEWNSNHYYDEDMTALINLVEFAQDESISIRARAVLDLLFFHIALNSWRGLFVSSAGRNYLPGIINPLRALTAPVAWLAWGAGTYLGAYSISAISLATSPYLPPPVLLHILEHKPQEMETFERHGLDVEEAHEFGLDPRYRANFPLFAQSGTHRSLVKTAREYVPCKHGNMEFGIRLASEYFAVAPAGTHDEDFSKTALTRADLYTFRTPQFMLSCAQDYRKGKPGYQQHIWQATLGSRALVFTTAPGPESGGRPGHWAGNTMLPRALAYRNVQLCFYRLVPRSIYGMQPLPYLPMTHGYFPRFTFDQVREKSGWVMGQIGDGYVALKPLLPWHWKEPEQSVLNALTLVETGQIPASGQYEMCSPGTHNVWVCELGNPQLHGSFDAFVEGMAGASIQGDDKEFAYQSPSAGLIHAGWDLPLTVNGAKISTTHYPRFQNPFCDAPFGTETFNIHCASSNHLVGLGSVTSANSNLL